MNRSERPSMSPMNAPTLTVGPLQYWWPRQTLMHFYAELADSPAHAIVLGEVTCSRRNEFSLEDWLAIARELQQAGKRVRLASMPLLMSEAELRGLRRLAEAALSADTPMDFEAGDASALQVWHGLTRELPAQERRSQLVLGPHINVYNRPALEELASLGAGVWVPPVEMSLAALARCNPPLDPVQAQGRPVATELLTFGRMPLAFSARCFTARHHRLSKDQCEFRCRDDADGLLLRTSEGQPFLALNGISTQSAGLQCLLQEHEAVRAAGVKALRLSPCSGGFSRVLALFDAVYRQGADADEALAQLQSLDLPGSLVHGFAHQQPGMQALA